MGKSMEHIRGWVRMADRADCGYAVAEGSAFDTSGGIGYTFRGARMACSRNCKIADGDPSSTLSNGAAQVLDGHSTSGGCRLISTLNGVDGVRTD